MVLFPMRHCLSHNNYWTTPPRRENANFGSFGHNSVNESLKWLIHISIIRTIYQLLDALHQLLDAYESIDGQCRIMDLQFKCPTIDSTVIRTRPTTDSSLEHLWFNWWAVCRLMITSIEMFNNWFDSHPDVQLPIRRCQSIDLHQLICPTIPISRGLLYSCFRLFLDKISCWIFFLVMFDRGRSIYAIYFLRGELEFLVRHIQTVGLFWQN